ncbi:hypothetical protein HpVH12_09250 [Helicobacter pylori]
MILGIDEAGRGCLAGSLFVAGVVCSEKNSLRVFEHGLKRQQEAQPKKALFLGRQNQNAW